VRVALVAAAVWAAMVAAPAAPSHWGVCRAFAATQEQAANKAGYELIVVKVRPYGEVVSRCVLAVTNVVIGAWACFIVDVDTSLRVWGKPHPVACGDPFVHVGRVHA
jgi:hypothetical protein